jgi:hypothetical protein
MPDWDELDPRELDRDDLDITPEDRRAQGAPELDLGDDGEVLTPVAEAGRRHLSFGIVVAVLLIGSVGVGVWWWRSRALPAPSETLSPAVEAVASPAASAPDLPSPQPTTLPPLAESDGFVRELLARLSSHPQVAAWVGADGLVQRFTAAVVNVSAGESPAVHLRHLEPKDRLRVVTRGGRSVIDPDSYARFDGDADALASLDVAAVAPAYRLLSPLLEAAYRELGHPEGGFDGRVAAAVRTLLDVPVVDGDVPVRPVVRARLLYEYADPRLESLSPAQKQLLRVGPRNVRIVQAWLREVAEALGLFSAR